MRTVGIDLSARDEHKAVIVDEAGRSVSPVFHFGTAPASLRRLLDMALEHSPYQEVQAGMKSLRKKVGSGGGGCVLELNAYRLGIWSGCSILFFRYIHSCDSASVNRLPQSLDQPIGSKSGAGKYIYAARSV